MNGSEKKWWLPVICLVSLLLLSDISASAHAINYDLSSMSRTHIGWIYLGLGFTHILPLGYDHILFVLSIFFLNPNIKVVIKQATAFTLAHSITLGLAMYGIIKPPSIVVEPIIALSIVFMALENIISDKVRPTRILIIFLFGLVHGMGFASALIGLGLPKTEFATGLLSFNIGVELGQIAVITIAYLSIAVWTRNKTWYKQRVVIPVSGVIACIAAFWTIQRVFF